MGCLSSVPISNRRIIEGFDPYILSPGTTTEEDKRISFNQVNYACTIMMGFIARVLIERHFFQNSNIPTETLIYLANDLIKMINPPKKGVFDTSKEVAILWKKMTGKSLTKEEQNYSLSEKEIDVTGQLIDGFKYVSYAMLGYQFYNSFSAVAKDQMWGHLPAIFGYYSVIVLGPLAVSYMVAKSLKNTSLTQEQKATVEPWLDMVARLALGFVPKVHATDEGVHYHYPSLEGHSQTISSHQTVTLRGDVLYVEREGLLQTPKGPFEGIYESEFKLREILELNQEQIKISVTDDKGSSIPLAFTRRLGEYGPEISVTCENKEIEHQWFQYFRPQPKALPPPDLSQGLAVKAGLAMPNSLIPSQTATIPQSLVKLGTPNINLFSTFSLLATLVTGSRLEHSSALASMIAFSAFSLLPKAEAAPMINPNWQKTIEPESVQSKRSVLELGINEEKRFLDKIAGIGKKKFASSGSKKRNVQQSSQWSSPYNLSTMSILDGFTIKGLAAGDNLGSSAGTGDFNGDGFSDFIVGASNSTSGGRISAGSAYVLFGPISNLSSFDLNSLDGIKGFTIEGLSAGDNLGQFVTSLKDISGDGIDEIFIGAPGAFSNAGSANIIFGQKTGWPIKYNLTNINITSGISFRGVNPGDSLGVSAVSIPDFNNDGYNDFAIGAAAQFGDTPNAGIAYVLFWKPNNFISPVNLSSLNVSQGFSIPGLQTDSLFAYSMASGEFNGDKIADLAFGANLESSGGITSAGNVYILFGGQGPWLSPYNLTLLNGKNGFSIPGIQYLSYFGFSVAFPGDLNGDGLGDFIAGAYGASPGNYIWGGITYGIFGQRGTWPATFNLNILNETTGFKLESIAAYDRLGSCVAFVGDINQDGLDDFITGAFGSSPYNRTNAGRAYIVFGSRGNLSSIPDVSFLNGTNGFSIPGLGVGDLLGNFVGSAGDINADGRKDFAIGAYQNSPLNPIRTGSIYLLYGKGNLSSTSPSQILGKPVPIPKHSISTLSPSTVLSPSTAPSSSLSFASPSILGSTHPSMVPSPTPESIPTTSIHPAPSLNSIHTSSPISIASSPIIPNKYSPSQTTFPLLSPSLFSLVPSLLNPIFIPSPNSPLIQNPTTQSNNLIIIIASAVTAIALIAISALITTLLLKKNKKYCFKQKSSSVIFLQPVNKSNEITNSMRGEEINISRDLELHDIPIAPNEIENRQSYMTQTYETALNEKDTSFNNEDTMAAT